MRLGLTFLLLVPVAVCAAEPVPGHLTNWHHWRGPLANGTAPNADPPLTWDAQTNVKWTANLPGKSSSTPIVWGDRVFAITAVATGKQANPADLPRVDPKFQRRTEPPTEFYQFLAYCFDRNTGKELWKHQAAEKIPHEGHHPTHSYAAGSPTTDGKRLYVSFGSFGIYCYDFDGTQLWSRDFGRLITRLGWGEAVTPVVHGDSLLLNWDQEADSKLICLDAATGKTRWEVPRDEVSSWNTPLVVEHNGTTQVILNGTKRVRSHDLATGKVLWSVGGMTANAIPSPVTADGVVYVVSGYRGSAGVAVALDSKGEVRPGAGVLWNYNKGTPYVPSPLLSKGRLWFTQGNVNLLTILDAKSGKPLVEQERLPSVRSFYASPVAAAGRIYFVDQSGTTLVFKDSDKLELLATNRLNDAIDASPAVAGKQLFLRSHTKLYCIEGK
jgi:outer membrane protein assembly factor BamB